MFHGIQVLLTLNYDNLRRIAKINDEGFWEQVERVKPGSPNDSPGGYGQFSLYFKMSTRERKEDQIISYLTLRTLIGAIGILLPLFLFITDSAAQKTLRIEDSISDYYDNGISGDLFVGVLFVLGFFLLSYKGYERIDNQASSAGFVFALGVALFPTMSDNKLVHVLHFVFATLLFSVFIFFSLYLFRKTKKDGTKTKQKVYRNRVYVTCGIIMIGCIACIALSQLKAFTEITDQYNLVFWLETIALVSFGFSWIVKGELLWKDAKKPAISDDVSDKFVI